ncbi:MAG: hypothetical protein NUW22_11500 [Acidobacteria bacterium]|nr:hypothetical protein [Acidobacteriota bacterium]
MTCYLASFPGDPDTVIGHLTIYSRPGLIEAMFDGGHWNLYEVTRQEAAKMLKRWREMGNVIERVRL